MSTIVYDAGALIAAEDGAERMWAIHKRAMVRGVQPVVPATVLAEVWRGGRRQHRLGQFVLSCEVEGFSDQAAKATGVLLSVVPLGIVDASVVECALRRASPCVTGNRRHLVELAGTRRLNIIDI
ncbi:MAG: twitching motility protein PilT [Geodermatophilaceae bacterium]|nr:twitching motility protein PilT [Geodermatophilaceae bacterium]